MWLLTPFRQAPAAARPLLSAAASNTLASADVDIDKLDFHKQATIGRLALRHTCGPLW